MALMKMARKGGLQATAQTGFGKGFDLAQRQPVAKGGIGVFETALEVLDQGGSQGQPL
jgi:hypothetical protein